MLNLLISAIIDGSVIYKIKRNIEAMSAMRIRLCICQSLTKGEYYG